MKCDNLLGVDGKDVAQMQQGFVSSKESTFQR